MKKFLLIVAVLFSCQSKSIRETENLKNKLFTFFNENLKSLDSTIHLDSVRIVKFDTVTENTVVYRKIMKLYDDINERQKQFDELKESQNKDEQMIRLTAGLDNALYQNSLDDYKKKMIEMQAIQSEDKITMQKADSLSNVLKTTDSTTLVYLQLKCLIQYQRKDLSVKRDTGYAFLDTEKNIVRKEDILK